MDILYLLIPLSAALVLIILALFGWAVHRGQFEDLEREGNRILELDDTPVEDRQGSRKGNPEESIENRSL